MAQVPPDVIAEFLRRAGASFLGEYHSEDLFTSSTEALAATITPAPSRRAPSTRSPTASALSA